jgi:hypothetical protein
MSDGDLTQALERLEDSVVVPQTTTAIAPIEDAKKSFAEERHFYADRHNRDMADRDAARDQRRLYAKCVFALVCAWIVAIYALLIFQVFGLAVTPSYKPLSDGVLIALISSTTVNLIGTLIIVLKYIFRIPGVTDSTKT